MCCEPLDSTGEFDFRGYCSRFRLKLWDAIWQADGPNRRRLAEGFPKEIEFAEAWNNIPGTSDLIREVANSDRQMLPRVAAPDRESVPGLASG